MIKYNYNIITIDATNGINELCYEYDGEIILYKKGNAEISIKLDDRTNDAIPLECKQSIAAPFKRFYISCEPYAGEIILYVAKPKDIKFEGLQADIDKISEIDSVKRAYSLVASNFAVGSTAITIAEANDNRKSIMVKNMDTSLTVYINGFPVEPKEALTLNYYVGELTAICNDGICQIYVLEETN